MDKNADTGEGVTASSCTTFRAHACTKDGAVLACEGFKYGLE